jgi:hypothetical protein
VEWNNINKATSWVKFFKLSLIHPKPIIWFEKNKNLFNKMTFYHRTQYCRSNTAIDIARILKVSTSPAGIKHKFFSMLRGKSQFMIFFRLFLELDLVYQTERKHDSNIWIIVCCMSNRNVTWFKHVISVMRTMFHISHLWTKLKIMHHKIYVIIIRGRNDFVLLESHDCFPSQMIWAFQWQ